MRLKDLLEKVNISELSADPDARISGVCADTRKLKPGELFVAIKGLRADGNAYIEEAASKGAACVICEEKPEASIPYILAPNAREAYASVSAAWFRYPADALKIVGVTGTNGKTTVASLIWRIIEESTGGKAGLIGTNGNKIGDEEYPAGYTTPDAFELHEFLDLAVKKGCKYVVMEVSSHALEQRRVHGICFEAGVFTNLTPDHLDYHADMDDYAAAKAMMFTKSRGSAINIDDGYAKIMMDSSPGKIATYSVENNAAELQAKNIRLSADRVDFCVLTIGNLIRVELPIPGMFSVYNALAAISCATLLGFQVEQIVGALQNCGPVKGRIEAVRTGRGFTVIIDYAHTPEALRSVLAAVRGFARGKVVTLFGCGGDRDKKKRPMMGAIAAEYSDYVVVTTDNPRTEEPRSIIDEILVGMEGSKTPKTVIENRREAIIWALRNAVPDEILVLAGKGHETYQIFGYEKLHFDEREIIAEYLMNEEQR